MKEVYTGTGRKITWNAGADWDGNFTNTAVARVTASRFPILSFAKITGGNFIMGDSFGEGGADEVPTRTVFVSTFTIGKTEVTKGEWDLVRTWGASHGYGDLRVGVGEPSHPVQDVDWFDMVKWCNAKSEMEGATPVYTSKGVTYKTGDSSPTINYAAKGYRLPTEAEWEKAARGGVVGKRFPWGDTINHSKANYEANGSAFVYDISGYSIYTAHPTYGGNTSPVGRFDANGYGLYDMSGNVLEWCNDWYAPYAGTSNPTGPANGTDRVFRGGQRESSANDLRCAIREKVFPELRGDGVGFRLVIVP